MGTLNPFMPLLCLTQPAKPSNTIEDLNTPVDLEERANLADLFIYLAMPV